VTPTLNSTPAPISGVDASARAISTLRDYLDSGTKPNVVELLQFVRYNSHSREALEQIRDLALEASIQAEYRKDRIASGLLSSEPGKRLSDVAVEAYRLLKPYHGIPVSWSEFSGPRGRGVTTLPAPISGVDASARAISTLRDYLDSGTKPNVVELLQFVRYNSHSREALEQIRDLALEASIQAEYRKDRIASGLLSSEPGIRLSDVAVEAYRSLKPYHGIPVSWSEFSGPRAFLPSLT
jgi:hypothetical protein